MRPRTPIAIAASASLVLLLAGCAGPVEAPGDDRSARFAACLRAAGIDARVGEQTGLVMVEDAALSALSTDGTLQVPDMSVTPDAAPLLVEMADDGSAWVAAESSAYFADDPDVHDAYRGCEVQQPDFAQPVFTGPGELDPADTARQRDDALAFSRCGREAGFDWLADPDPATPESVTLPDGLSEAEFRSLLVACWDSERPIVSWSLASRPDFDFGAVLEEFAGSGGGGAITFSVPVAP